MKSFCRFLLGCALVALPASASGATFDFQELLNSGFESISSVFGAFFRPSPERLALQKAHWKQLLSLAEVLEEPEQLNGLKGLVDLTIQCEEELLQIYTRMLEVKAQIDAEGNPEAEEELRTRMRGLMEEYRARIRKRDEDFVNMGLVTADEAKTNGVKGARFLEDLLSKMVFAPFEKYT